MAVLEIRGPGSDEGAQSGLRRALDAEGDVPFTLASEPFRIIEPPSFSSGKAFCTVNRVPLTLMPKSLSKCSSVIFPRGANSATPALAKTTSLLPLTAELLQEMASPNRSP